MPNASPFTEGEVIPLVPYVFEAVAEQQAIRETGVDPAPYRRALLAYLVLDKGYGNQQAGRVINRAESELVFHRREIEALGGENA
jgi:hypothetical protein